MLIANNNQQNGTSTKHNQKEKNGLAKTTEWQGKA